MRNTLEPAGTGFLYRLVDLQALWPPHPDPGAQTFPRRPKEALEWECQSHYLPFSALILGKVCKQG